MGQEATRLRKRQIGRQKRERERKRQYDREIQREREIREQYYRERDLQYDREIQEKERVREERERARAQSIIEAEQLRLSLIPKCPICGEQKEPLRRISKCKHAICKDCLKAYISVDIKNISKYPLQCFQFQCQELLTYKDVEYAFKYDKKMLEIYEKFSIMKAIPEQQRLECPKCQMLFFIQSRQFFINENCGAVCTRCQFQFCLDCKQKWHPEIDCARIKQTKEEIEDKQSKQSMLANNYRQCPGCQTFIEKKDLDTCNHMTHKNCPNPIPVPVGVNQTDFCYCCSEVLYGENHDEEKDGQSHFPIGVFGNCRKHDAAIQTRNQEQSKLTKEIKLLTDQLNYIKK